MGGSDVVPLLLLLLLATCAWHVDCMHFKIMSVPTLCRSCPRMQHAYPLIMLQAHDHWVSFLYCHLQGQVAALNVCM